MGLTKDLTHSSGKFAADIVICMGHSGENMICYDLQEFILHAKVWMKVFRAVWEYRNAEEQGGRVRS